MHIIQAKAENKSEVLRLLDLFRDACSKLITPDNPVTHNSAREHGGDLFDEVIESDKGAIFLAEDKGAFIGIITVYLIPQIRKGCYVAEGEEMYVIEEYQGSGVAAQLMQHAETWAKEKGISAMRLESSNELQRAHRFYEKVGFKHYGKTYMKDLK